MIDALTLDQLRVLIAIADAGSFSAAGRRLQRVQSAISQSIHGLELTLQLQLFDRAEKQPRLTEAGRAVLADARRVVEAVERLRAHAEGGMQGLEAELAIAIDPLLPYAVVMEVLREARAQFPRLSVRLLTDGAGAAERHLRQGQARVAILPLDMADPRDLEAEFLTEVRMVPVVAAFHPLAQAEGVLSRDDLAPHVQLVLLDTSNAKGWPRDIAADMLWYFADLNTRLAFLLGGFGWSNMPVHLVASRIESGELKCLRIQAQGNIVVALHVVYPRGRTLGRAGRWMVDQLRRRLAPPA